ncbi:hypothetical protein HK098_003057 [Nowakowskiella sp. JEL0407]|nr:hypothetical protein HK098_003057 [Nowakowskiella sp. JEL0407]
MGDLSKAKKWHIFVSYRVRTDAEFAEKLTDKLRLSALTGEKQDIRVSVFLDKQELRQGHDYMNQLSDALNTSCLFLPIVSEPNFETFLSVEEGDTDNVLWEWENALKLMENQKLHIIPLLIGTNPKINGTTSYTPFNKFGIPIPEVHTSHCQTQTVKETTTKLLKLQGIFINPLDMREKIDVIVDKFSHDVWPSYRHLWSDQTAIGPEPIYTCVQCQSDFKQSENGSGSCRFHKLDGAACCQKDGGCTRSIHRIAHHNDWKYAGHSSWAYSILNYTNMSETFAEVSAENYHYGNAETVTVSVGVVLPDCLEYAGRLFIAAWIKGIDQRWFMIYEQDDISGADRLKPIFQLEEEAGKCEARWVFDEFAETMLGVEVICDTETATKPSISFIEIIWNDEKPPKVGKIVEKSRGKFGEILNTKPYFIPPPQFKGDLLCLPENRPAEQFDPWQQNSSGLRVKLKSSDQAHTYRHWDSYCANFVIVNPTDHPIGILECNSYWRFRDAENAEKNDGRGADWTQADDSTGTVVNEDFRSREIKVLPQQVPAFGTLTLRINAGIQNVPQYETAYVGKTGWMNRLGPVLVDFVLEDLDGGKCGCTVEFIWNGVDAGAVALPDKSDKELLKLVTCDNVKRFSQYTVRVRTKPTPKVPTDPMFELYFNSYNSFYISPNSCRRTVTQAIAIATSGGGENGSTSTAVQQVDENLQKVEGFDVKYWILVDIKLRQAYAFKITIKSETCSVSFVHPIGPYGDMLDAEAEKGDPTDAPESAMDPECEVVKEARLDARQLELYKSGLVFPSTFFETPKSPFEPRVKPTIASGSTAVAAPASAAAATGVVGAPSFPGYSLADIESVFRRVVAEEYEKMKKEVAREEKVVALTKELDLMKSKVERLGDEVDRLKKEKPVSSGGVDVETIRSVVKAEVKNVGDNVIKLGHSLVGGRWE